MNEGEAGRQGAEQQPSIAEMKQYIAATGSQFRVFIDGNTSDEDIRAIYLSLKRAAQKTAAKLQK